MSSIDKPDSTARYFETIGPGPELFAIIASAVYYHDQNQWFKYKSAYDVVFGTMKLPD
jgi:hypothetical protein